MVKYIIILLALIGCGRAKEQTSTNPTEALANKFSIYLSQSPKQMDKIGYTIVDKCDGLLWASLYRIAGGMVNVGAAEINPGEWVRNPDRTCTSISRDMFIGLMHFIWHTKNLPMVENLIVYGENHNFKMSAEEELDGAEILTPDLIATLYELRYRLGGPDSVARYFADSFWIKGQLGYLTNLQMLHIYLRGLMLGSVATTELELLKEHSDRNPDNALFSSIYHSFLDGDQTQAINSLMNEKYFPKNELPNNNYYCESVFLFQREEFINGVINPDWSPCDGVTTKPGIDLELSSAIILGKIK